jgi:dolichol-phosphate mannosyltransferase
MPELLSIILPVLNEEAIIPAAYERIKKAVSAIGWRYEFIFVDDGSTDNSLSILEELARQDSQVKVISFSRNFGHQIAITAGCDHCSGKYAVIMDSDMQDPPELIPQLIAKADEGFDVVYAVRKNRQAETWFKKTSASLFYRIFAVFSNIPMPLDTGDFRLINRKVLQTLRGLKEKNRFMRGLVSWVGFKQTGILYDRESRQAGNTKYHLFKMMNLSVDGIVSFSTVPLKLASLLGLIISVLSFLLGLYCIGLKLFTNQLVQGWLSLLISILFIGGVQLIFLGIIGEYLGRIYDEVKQRPLYVVNKKANLDA